MKKLSTLVTFFLSICTVYTAQAETFEYPSANALPYDDTRVFPRDPALLTGHDFNLSAERFANAWLSKTNERERIKATLYLLGVLDSTEGSAWCDSRQVLPNSRYEMLYPYFEHLNAEQKKQRASTLIVAAMADIMPCKSKK